MCNINLVCKYLVSEQSGSNPLDKLASFNNKTSGNQCTNVDNNQNFVI
jgi:hypothetical protein